MRKRKRQLSSSLTARLAYAGFFLLALTALLMLGFCKGWARLAGAGLLLVTGLFFALFLTQILPKLIQHDMAVNTLLASASLAETEEEGEVPPLNLLLDEVMQDVQKSYMTALSQNQNSLAVLQSQINPHFLYNTLDCIRGEALEAEMDDIASMVESLSSFFRCSTVSITSIEPSATSIRKRRSPRIVSGASSL